jgi:hypothetical protein
VLAKIDGSIGEAVANIGEWVGEGWQTTGAYLAKG